VKQVTIERIANRLIHLVREVETGSALHFYDRLRALKEFCEETPTIAQVVHQLPDIPYDFEMDWREISAMWPSGIQGYGVRWSAICQVVEGGTQMVSTAWLQIGDRESIGLQKWATIFVVPLAQYILDQLEVASSILYLLLRYKRWAEWFEAARLRQVYDNEGEDGLDRDVRRFLFENGIDYPFSQPRSPGGQVDIVAGLETNDPLVLEVKVWDSNKSYGINRVRDGLRQVMNYVSQYGKDRGYLLVFNVDVEPLHFTTEQPTTEWPPRLMLGGRTYFFVDIHIATQTEPVSVREKGKMVRVHEVYLPDLVALLNNE
jgi:hypothetical protein